jgi:hypothetical protein
LLLTDAQELLSERPEDVIEAGEAVIDSVEVLSERLEDAFD